MENLIIESDNLIAMRKLLPEYEGKIDVMPIDPPYNTNISYVGYKDFDSRWNVFMRERLEVAYKLLSNRGVMFIHIDENECVDLYHICLDIFGCENVRILIWKKTNDYFDKNRIEKPLENGIRRTHEFVLLCGKNLKETVLKPIMQPTLQNGKVVEREKPLETVIDFFGTTSSAKDEIAALFGDRTAFPTPKPMKLIKEFVRAASEKDSIVLDFFAGSGTTGHAVMDLNKEDGGSRKFILITNNENNICRDVTYERIKRIIDKEGYAASLKYYKVDYVPISERLYYEYADELLCHVRELVELENGINFTGNAEIAIVLTEDELAEFMTNIEAYGKCRKLYMGHDLLPDEQQEKSLAEHGIEKNIIPDYYYRELQEV